MTFSFRNLDIATRKHMVECINEAISTKKLYLSSRLNTIGTQKYPTLLTQAAECQNEFWLAEQIHNNSLLNSTEVRTTKNGSFHVNIPHNAAQTLAEAEFNRYYMMAICKQAIISNDDVVTYRARESSNPRPESEALIGKLFNPEILLQELMVDECTDGGTGLPVGPNSGISITFNN